MVIGYAYWRHEFGNSRRKRWSPNFSATVAEFGDYRYSLYSLQCGQGFLYVAVIAMTTKKLSYRKDHRAMRPIYGCPEKFRESLSTPTAIFAQIFNELFSDRSYEII